MILCAIRCFFSLQFNNNLIPGLHGPQSIQIMYAAFNIEKVGTRLIIVNQVYNIHVSNRGMPLG